MQELNYLSMISAVRDCITTDGLSVCIFTRLEASRSDVLSEVIESMTEEEQDAVLWISKSANTAFIEFKNKSCIRVAAANEKARGYRFHKVLYEEDIEREILDDIIRPIEKPRF